MATAIAIELESPTATRYPLRLVLEAAGVLTVSEGPPQLRGRWTGEDWFGAMLELRRRAEQLELRPLIAGAQAKVWPSIAQREAGGLELTRLERTGEARRVGGTVGLFEPAPIERVVSLSEQRLSWTRWLQEPRERLYRATRKRVDEASPPGVCVIVPTPADDPRLAFVGGTLGWWRLALRPRDPPSFRANPRTVRIAEADGQVRIAEILYERKSDAVHLRLWGAGTDAVGRGVDAFVALADLREQIAGHGITTRLSDTGIGPRGRAQGRDGLHHGLLRLLVQGARRDAWRFSDEGETVTITPLGRLKYAPRADLLDRSELSAIASVDEQRLYRQMVMTAVHLASDEDLAWAEAEPESWRPVIWGADPCGNFGPRIVGWWRSDAWGRVVEFRPNPRPHGRAPMRSIEELVAETAIFEPPYPLDCW